MTTIAYDLPVKNLIAGLDATGHVTHTQHRKTHVTLHHNGGRLSHEGVLQVWQTRPASAQFDVDINGDLAQYVRVAEYAWACGNTLGNQCSISIEMCNLTGGPDWLVADTTWRSAARLAGWLFARVIGYRPTREFLVQHEVWSATSCAGPYIDQVYEQILALAQTWYDRFVSGNVDEEEEEDVNVYPFAGQVFKDAPEWVRVDIPPVRASTVLPANDQSCAWVQIGCPQREVEIWAVYRLFDGGAELLWGPGHDPRLPFGGEQPSPMPVPVKLRPDKYKAWRIWKPGTIGFSVLYRGPVPLNGLVSLLPKGDGLGNADKVIG
jgi:hypothetical protein